MSPRLACPSTRPPDPGVARTFTAFSCTTPNRVGAGVKFGGAGVAVGGGAGVAVGGSGVAVGRAGVAVGGAGVAVGGTSAVGVNVITATGLSIPGNAVVVGSPAI